jgi:glycosyltransferase involved in cell wall biosynthesis
MLRAVVTTARSVAVHNRWVASELREQFPNVVVETIRMGVGSSRPLSGATVQSVNRRRHHLKLPDEAIVFAAFGKVTPEKRIGAILRALSTIVAEGIDAYVMLVGDAGDYPGLGSDLARLGIAGRVRVTGYVADDAIGEYLNAADVCLCLRWPTAQESSASWLQCLSAARPTLISDLAHLVDVPNEVARRIDLLDEDRALAQAMRDLAAHPEQRSELARAGHAYWTAGHTLPLMADDYRRVMRDAAARPAPVVSDLPAHLTDDHSARAGAIAREFGVHLDFLS